MHTFLQSPPPAMNVFFFIIPPVKCMSVTVQNDVFISRSVNFLRAHSKPDFRR